MHNYIGAKIDWSAKVGCRESGIDHQGEIGIVSDLCQYWNIQYF
jgi:hypothetical protein